MTKKCALVTDTYIVQDVLGYERRGARDFYKILWKNYPPSDATWEPRSNIDKDVELELKMAQLKADAAPVTAGKKRSSAPPPEGAPVKRTRRSSSSGRPLAPTGIRRRRRSTSPLPAEFVEVLDDGEEIELVEEEEEVEEEEMEKGKKGEDVERDEVSKAVVAKSKGGPRKTTKEKEATPYDDDDDDDGDDGDDISDSNSSSTSGSSSSPKVVSDKKARAGLTPSISTSKGSGSSKGSSSTKGSSSSKSSSSKGSRSSKGSGSSNKGSMNVSSNISLEGEVTVADFTCRDGSIFVKIRIVNKPTERMGILTVERARKEIPQELLDFLLPRMRFNNES